MKNFILAALLAFISAPAFSDTAGPLWTCGIKGNMSGFSAGLIIGGQSLKGDGLISCTSLDGEYAEIPVRLQLSGFGLGLGFSDVRDVAIISTGIGVVSGAEALLGRYNVGASTGTTLIAAGFDVDAAFAVAKAGGAGFEVGLRGKDALGLEAHLHGIVFEISPL